MSVAEAAERLRNYWMSLGIKHIDILPSRKGLIVRFALPEFLRIRNALNVAIVRDAENYAAEYGIGVRNWADSYYVYIEFIEL